MLPEPEWELFADCRCLVAEGPRWNGAEQRLYWVDIPRGTVYRKSLPGELESYSPGVGKIGAVEFFEGELLLFGAGCRVWRCAFGAAPELFAELPGRSGTRFNDVLADRAGHFFCDVAWDPAAHFAGELWRFDPAQRRFALLAEGFAGMPNGMGIAPDRRTLYLAVSEERRVYRFELEEKNGTLGARELFAAFLPEEGNPDGLAVDPESGRVLIAFWGGAALRTFSPAGTLLCEERFPIEKITSVAVSGEKLFLTTGNLPWSEAAWQEAHAGAVFCRKRCRD